MILRPARRAAGIERTLIRQVFDSAPPGAINLGLGQPDLPTPAVASLAGISGIVEGRTGYTPTSGDARLRAAVASRYGPSQAAGPESVLITCGSQEAMFVACWTLADEGGEILYPEPGYPAYPVVARLVGARGVPYPLRAERGFCVGVDDIAPRLTDATELVILNAPSNPTGACHHREDLAPLLELLAERGIPWLSDEVYAGFCYEAEHLSPAEVLPSTGLVVSGLSKDMSMTGWRVGWVVGPPDVVARATAVHQYVVTCASSISQCAALGALTAEGRAERARYLEVFRGRRESMADELSRVPGVRFELPEGAFYFFVDISRHGPSLDVARRILERQQVITIPGVAFGRAGEGYLRLSFAASSDDIVRGVRAIARELGG